MSTRPRAPRRKASPTAPTNRYDAAGMGRRIASWNPPSSGPRRAVEGTAKLIHRARDSARNDWAAGAAGQKWATNLIGVGIRPRFKRIADAARRQALTDLWDDFVADADADGVLDFYGLQTLAVREWFDAGEVFIRLRPRLVDAPLAVPLQVQLIERDYVPMLDATVWPGLPDGNRIVQGVEVNKWGRRVAYWMFKEHPGDGQTAQSATPQNLIRVAASQVLHMFEPTRAGQMRGVSQLASVLARLRMGNDLEDGVLDRQRLANLYMAFITRAMPQDWDDIDTDPDTGLPKWYDTTGRAVAKLMPGTTQELMPGESVTFANPPEAGISHPEYLRSVNMGTAAGGGLPYETLSGDIRGVSDRTLRVIMLEFRRHARQRQWQMVIPMMCRPIVAAFASAALLASKVTVDEVDLVRRAEWSPEGWEHIHPVQDPQGRKIEVDAGFRSRDSVIAERGDDPDAVDLERQQGQQREENLGLPATGAPAPSPTSPGA